MPSGAGVNAANRQLDEVQRLMQEFLSVAGGNTNISAAAFNQFLQGLGPFASQLLGANGTESLLAQLQQFRSGLTNPLAALSLPPIVQQAFEKVGLPTNVLSQLIGQSGQTGDTQAIRDLLNAIAGGATGPQAGVQSFADRILGSWGQTGPMGSGIEAALQAIQNGGFNAGLQNLANVGGSIVNQRGYGPETQGAMDFFSQILAANGQTPGTQQLGASGQNLLNARGMTPEMQQLQNYITHGLGTGGYTPGIQDAISQGRSLVNQGGMTGPMTAFLQDINNGIAAQGMTPEASRLFEKVMGIVNANGVGGALLPMDTVISMARAAAGARARSASEAARRSAFQRIGGAAYAGSAEQALGEFSDAALASEAADVRAAASKQQELQLSQLLGAMGVGGDLTKAATGLLGQYFGAGADLFRSAASNINAGSSLMLGGEDAATRRMLGFLGAGGDLSRIASTNMGIGGDLMKAAEGIAATRMGIGAEGFQDTIANTIARLNAGSSMIGAANAGATDRLLGGISGITGITGLGNSAQLGAAGLLAGLTGNSLQASQNLTGLAGLESGNLFSSTSGLAQLLGLGNTMLTDQQRLALQANGQNIDALLNSLGLSSNISNSFTNNWFQGANGLTNIAQLYTALAGQGMNAFGDLSQALIRAQMQPGFWGSLGGSLLQGALGGLTGGLGGLLTGSLGSIFGGNRNKGLTGWANGSGGIF